MSPVSEKEAGDAFPFLDLKMRSRLMATSELRARLRLPNIVASKFLITDAGRVIASYRAGLARAFPAKNARTIAGRAAWFDAIEPAPTQAPSDDRVVEILTACGDPFAKVSAVATERASSHSSNMVQSA
ncbi:MAG: hypothetical protein Q8L66_14120 [Caulobacter sp.]|nr:hypothetical protein [Caulobacter sp.]